MVVTTTLKEEAGAEAKEEGKDEERGEVEAKEGVEAGVAGEAGDAQTMVGDPTREDEGVGDLTKAGTRRRFNVGPAAIPKIKIIDVLGEP